MAQKMRTMEEKALKSIMKSEASRKTYKKIKNIFGKQQIPLKQIDVPSPNGNPTHPHTTLPSQAENE